MRGGGWAAASGLQNPGENGLTGLGPAITSAGVILRSLSQSRAPLAQSTRTLMRAAYTWKAPSLQSCHATWKLPSAAAAKPV